MVSESRIALMFSGYGTHFVATPAVFPESVQMETLQPNCFCEMCHIFFHDADRAIFSLCFEVNPFSTKQVFPLRRCFLPPAVFLTFDHFDSGFLGHATPVGLMFKFGPW